MKVVSGFFFSIGYVFIIFFRFFNSSFIRCYFGDCEIRVVGVR